MWILLCWTNAVCWERALRRHNHMHLWFPPVSSCAWTSSKPPDNEQWLLRKYWLVNLEKQQNNLMKSRLYSQNSIDPVKNTYRLLRSEQKWWICNLNSLVWTVIEEYGEHMKLSQCHSSTNPLRSFFHHSSTSRFFLPSFAAPQQWFGFASVQINWETWDIFKPILLWSVTGKKSAK